MKKYEKYTTPAAEHTRVSETKCDLCGKIAHFASQAVDRVYWETSSQIWTSVYCETESETYHFECGFDLCPACFREKLVPWLESQGAVPQVEEYKIQPMPWEAQP